MKSDRILRRFPLHLFLCVSLCAVFARPGIATATEASIAIPIVSPRGGVDRQQAAELRWQPPSTPRPLAKYDVTLYRFDENGANPTPFRRTSVPAGQEYTRALSGNLAPGLYAWKVEARDPDGHIIGAGQTRFRLQKPAGPLQILVGADFFRVNYVGSNNDFVSDVPIEANGYTGIIEYQFPPRWKAILEFNTSSMSLNDQSLGFSGFKIGPRYTRPMKSNPDWAWFGELKYSSNSIPEITAVTPTRFQTALVKRTSIDPEIGTEYIIFPGLTARFEVGLAWTRSLSGGGYGTILESRPPLGYHFGGGFVGSFTPSIGYDLRLRYFKDGFAYSTATDSPSVDFKGYDALIAATYRF